MVESVGKALDVDTCSQYDIKGIHNRMKYNAQVSLQTRIYMAVLDKLKGTSHELWIPFWNQFDAYCKSVCGILNIPVSYVYREVVEVPINVRNQRYNTMDDFYMAQVVLNGEHYDKDNSRVYNLLEPLVSKGKAFAFIQKFQAAQDGCGAIFEIRRNATGDSNVDTRKMRANAMLKNLTYNSKQKSFTFNNYLEKWNYAYQELYKYQQPEPERRSFATSSTYTMGVLNGLTLTNRASFCKTWQ
jgi:hypothetical protein